jgi:hypothetical protein
LATKQIASALASSSAASPGSFEVERPGRRTMPKAVNVAFSMRVSENSCVSVGLAPG